MSKKKYDYAILGGGWPGWTLARGLTSQGAQVLVIDGMDTLFTGPAWNEVGSSPAAPEDLHLWRTLTGIDFGVTSQDLPPLLCDGTDRSSFVGFGDAAPECVELLEPLLSPQQLRFSRPPEDLFQDLRSQITAEVREKSLVTALEWEGDRIAALMINGQTRILVENTIYCGPLMGLKDLIPTERWSPRALSKLAKLKSWTAVAVTLELKEGVTAPSEKLLMPGTPQDQAHPCVQIPISPNSVAWVSFRTDIDAEDAEELGGQIKRMKRQAKHSQPELIENILSEKIQVQTSWGVSSQLQGIFPEVEGFTVASGALGGPGWIGGLYQGLRTLKSLGFDPEIFSTPGTQASQPSESQIADPSEMVDAPL